MYEEQRYLSKKGKEGQRSRLYMMSTKQAISVSLSLPGQWQPPHTTLSKNCNDSDPVQNDLNTHIF